MKTPVPMFLSFLALVFLSLQHDSYKPAENTLVTAEVEVTGVKVTGSPGTYTFDVTLSSQDTGCEQYADWWEVADDGGTLLYRRILGHSHVKEQPFTRGGGPVPAKENDALIIRGHMNNSGYGSKVFRGSVAKGFRQESAEPGFAQILEKAPPQPQGCAF